ncbi:MULTISPECIES: arginase family protein [unclassified Ruegeria]|uniref:arginase family protein n=1 Tax=unclassified Ruegeria TaxID=2625375 RepID=UPI0014891737|nr:MULTISPECIES: arginase family protein [unclassified Ruegeria]
MGDAAQIQFDTIPSFLGIPVGDLEDLVPGQVAIAGYFCDNLARPSAGQRYLARQLRYASRPGEAPANAIDLGDVNVFPLEPDKHFPAVASQCAAVLETGARMVLVGGDSSGLEALGVAAQKFTGADVPVIPVTGGVAGQLPHTHPVILSVDLQELAANWISHPRRLTGLSPAQMIAQIDAIPGDVIGAAVFGLAPELDNRGRAETSAALAILQAVTERLEKGER